MCQGYQYTVVHFNVLRNMILHEQNNHVQGRLNFQSYRPTSLEKFISTSNSKLFHPIVKRSAGLAFNWFKRYAVNAVTPIY